MPDLSVMILCGRSPRHLFVANRLCRAARPLAIVQETGSQWTARKLLQLARPEYALRKAWRWLRDRRRYVGNAEAKFFFGTAAPKLDRTDLVRAVPHINDASVAALADSARPDVIAVFGTSLIRAPLLGMGRLGMVNLHGGLSPEYRGADCTFWALYNGEPQNIGCTLHYIDAGIDTGRLIAHVCPPVSPGEDELTLFWRAVKESADVYAELFERLARGERLGEAQSRKGALYQVRDRGWRHERELAARMRAGTVVREPLPLRVRWFLRSAPPAAKQAAGAPADGATTETRQAGHGS